MSPSSLSSSQFLGLRIPLSPRSSSSSAFSPPSPSALRSPAVSAAYAAASDRGHAAPTAVAPPSSPPASSLYGVLGVSSRASGQEIKAAYRRLALECHPDVVRTGRRGASAEEFMRVHAAYATLSDPGKRAEYDRELTAAAAAMHIRNRSSAATAASPWAYSRSTSYPGYGRRTWETDQCW
ncbi:hypothetical protein Cni_G18447 [Canna indica]|uniref:J domain-containing protein n=1 Tax=Canna indica TaxID=4628 RepID=A0AAQ3KJC6_9LILI|nr:hypothetical protein Cni_G18447 [Canna indica]